MANPLFKCFEPNPSTQTVARGKRKGMPRTKSDCVVRAFCKLWDKDWDTTARILFERALIERDIPNSPDVWKKFLKRSSALHAKASDPRYRAGYHWKTVKEVAKETEMIDGVFICSCPNHIVAVANGYIYDSWDSSNLTVREVFEDPDHRYEKLPF